ncbi:MAG: CHAT domain-containing protein [Acidobacteriota bacterium]
MTTRFLLGWTLMFFGWPALGGGQGAGVVVEIVHEGFAAHRADLRPGDLLVGWERAASPPANPLPASGAIDSPFDLIEIEIEQAPRGELTLSAMRDRRRMAIVVPVGNWRLRTRPRLSTAGLAAYEDAAALIDQGAIDQGLALWLEQASAWRESGDLRAATWLFFRSARTAAENRLWDLADHAFEEARRSTEAESWVAAIVIDGMAKAFLDRSEFERATAAYREALEIRRMSSARSLGVAKSLNSLGLVAWYHSDLTAAGDFYSRSLAMREKLAPFSLDVAMSLNNLGAVAWSRGDLATAEENFRRSLTIREKLTPSSSDVAASLANIGGVAMARGDLVAAEGLFRRALSLDERLAPDSLDIAISFGNVGEVARRRGDLASAEAYFRRSLVIRQKLAPNSLHVARSFLNLGVVAVDRGDLPSAEAYYRRSLEIEEKLAPQSRSAGIVLNNLGVVAMERGALASAEAYFRRALTIFDELESSGLPTAACLASLGSLAVERQDLETAESYFRRSLAMHQEVAPSSVATAEILRLLGDLDLDRGDLGSAEAWYERSLAIRRERAPGSAVEAESCQRLAALNRLRNRFDQALDFYACAVDALEAQRSKLGGSDEVRSGFGAKYGDIYRESIDLLADSGQEVEAFHLLERYRAAELVRLLAQRDLVFPSDLPRELEARRRQANQSYDRAFEKWMHLPVEVGVEERQEAHQELEAARRRQDEIRAEVRAAAPRLAELQDPKALDLGAVRAALDPGTLLLSYSIGEEESHLFAVEARHGSRQGEEEQGSGLQEVPLAFGEAKLRTEIEDFRQAIGRGRVDRRKDQALLLARRLSEQLLAPVSDRIERAERLLILADGPLHSLPFAALVDPTVIDGRRFLVEAKPIYHAASASVFALLKQERRERRATRLTAFGDPHYPRHRASDEATGPQLRAALRSGFDFPPLPATRLEVESLRRTYPQGAEIFLGEQATEEKAKAVGRQTTHLHIASHGLLDDRFPLDSALVLTLPEVWKEGQDNGLLQAWEIFEQVRIDADLVTLSACDTGRGKVLGGEGLLGLTRAFHYAGARSVLASLWSVADESTGRLMQRFYVYLEEGLSKADALRRAQLDLVRGNELSHPFHWAGFQLIGDWR